MLGLFVLNNDAVNIVTFPIGSKYFWTFWVEVILYKKSFVYLHSKELSTALTLQTIDNYIKEIQDGTEDFSRFNLSEHAGLCTACAPLIGASIIASYATASITSSSHAEGCEGSPANWQIDECQEKLIEQWDRLPICGRMTLNRFLSL